MKNIISLLLTCLFLATISSGFAQDKEKEKKADLERMPGPREFKVLKYSSRGGQRPEMKRVTILGNQRLAAGGQVKRAKPKQKSVKKKNQI